MKVLKAFIKLFEAPQRSLKIKTEVSFYSEIHGAGRVKEKVTKNACTFKYLLGKY